MRDDVMTISRRDAFRAIGCATAAVALSGRASAQDAPVMTSPKALPQGSGFYRTHIGEFEITLISDGSFPIQPYPTFGANASEAEVNAVLQEAFLSTTNLTGQVNCVLVKHAGAPLTLIDSGCGKLFGPLTGFALTNLSAAGYKPEDIEQLIFTHLHPDHVGGALTPDGKPTFANAKVRVHQSEIDFWTADAPDFSKSGVPEESRAGMIGAARTFLKTAGSKVEAFKGESTEILPGMTALLSGGHTPGHCMMQFESNKEKLMYLTDLAIQSVIVFRHPQWWVGFDTDREKTAQIRQTLFAKLAAERALTAGSHLPFPSLGHVRKLDAGFEFVPAPWQWT